jgi:hypothetical protein
MAKISARRAYEVARVTRPGCGDRVLCSDGRVLKRVGPGRFTLICRHFAGDARQFIVHYEGQGFTAAPVSR